MKKFLLVIGMAATLFGMTACSSQDSSLKVDNNVTYNEDAYKSAIMDDINTLASSDDATLESYLSSETAGVPDFVEGWMQTRDEVGTVNGYGDWKFETSDDGGLIVTVVIDGSEHDADFKIAYTKSGDIEYTTFGVQYSTGEKLTKAVLNTLIGMSLVFVVLIFISFIISLFKYISVFEQKMKDKKTGNNADKTSSVDNTIAQIVQKEEEDLTDDLELVAVIAAAIAASEGTSPDGFVVRSIKKVNKNRWQNA